MKAALRGIDRVLAPLSWVVAALVVVLLFAGPSLIGAKKEPASGAAPAASPPAGEAEQGEGGGGGAPSGEAVFAEAGCAGCHTLAAAGASGAIGPNLDQAKPDESRVIAIVTSGSGAMPSFKGRLSAEEIEAVAEYVATSAGS